MKKIVMALALAVVTLAANAQDQTTAATTPATTPILSKRGYAILPEAGDWGLSMDAAPLLNYIGNAFHGTTYNTITTSTPAVSIPGITKAGSATNIVGITGKYFLDANTAIRGRLNIGLGSTTTKQEVQVSPATNPATYTTDNTKTTNSTIVLAGGIEKRKGIGRVQGFYGAELVISAGGGSTVTLSPGNAINSVNTGPITTKTKTAGSFLVGPRAFVGAEYFFAPKLSLGGEFGWGIYMGSTGKSSSTTQQWDPTTSSVKTTTTPNTATNNGGGGSSFGTSIDNLGGSINLNFYF